MYWFGELLPGGFIMISLITSGRGGNHVDGY